jgi:tRNA1Val (adenine37-N6)-methyltransferase
MKVGTDGVLLGAWTDVVSAQSILDIGTGTGLIALMCAQRSNSEAHIDAVEIDADAATQACENVAASPFANKITIHNADIKLFESGIQYDCIVCNPPYFSESLRCPDKPRNTARHTDTLPFATLLSAVEKLLSNDGTFNIILPVTEGEEFIDIACSSQFGFALHSRVNVYPTPQAEPKRLLLALRKTDSAHYETQTDTLVIEHSRHVYTEEYIALTKDFYLKM